MLVRLLCGAVFGAAALPKPCAYGLRAPASCCARADACATASPCPSELDAPPPPEPGPERELMKRAAMGRSAELPCASPVARLARLRAPGDSCDAMPVDGGESCGDEGGEKRCGCSSASRYSSLAFSISATYL